MTVAPMLEHMKALGLPMTRRMHVRYFQGSLCYVDGRALAEHSIRER
jgi:hypothetical protein